MIETIYAYDGDYPEPPRNLHRHAGSAAKPFLYAEVLRRSDMVEGGSSITEQWVYPIHIGTVDSWQALGVVADAIVKLSEPEEQ